MVFAHFSGLMRHYGPQHPDYADCQEARQQLSPLVHRLPSELRASVS
jgi:hypothetical protein